MSHVIVVNDQAYNQSPCRSGVRDSKQRARDLPSETQDSDRCAKDLPSETQDSDRCAKDLPSETQDSDRCAKDTGVRKISPRRHKIPTGVRKISPRRRKLLMPLTETIQNIYLRPSFTFHVFFFIKRIKHLSTTSIQAQFKLFPSKKTGIRKTTESSIRKPVVLQNTSYAHCACTQFC